MVIAWRKWAWFTGIAGILFGITVGIFFLRARSGHLPKEPDVSPAITRMFRSRSNLFAVGWVRNTPTLWHALPRLADRLGIPVKHLPEHVPQFLQLLGDDAWFIGQHVPTHTRWIVWTHPVPVLEKGLRVFRRVLPRGWSLQPLRAPRGCRSAFVLRGSAFPVPVYGSFCRTLLILTHGRPVPFAAVRPIHQVMRTVHPVYMHNAYRGDLVVWWVPERLPVTGWIHRAQSRIMPNHTDMHNRAIPMTGIVRITDHWIEFRIGF